MVEVRVAAVDPNTFSGNGDKYLNRIGEIVGVTGQFVLVQFTDGSDPHRHAFLPQELSMF